jgi:dolichol-phosphate mannosyltransferase
MDRNKPKLLSVVIPLYNEEGNIPELYDRLCQVLENCVEQFEIVMVDNGSVDGTLEILKKLTQSDQRVRYISLSRNFTAQGGILAGLNYAQGDVIISMDGDLQHPPETIPELIEKWQAGFDVVNTLKREQKSISLFRRGSNKLFYWFISLISEMDLNGGYSDFRLMSRQALTALLSLPEKRIFLRGLSRWIGFEQTGVYYDVAERHAGETKFSFRNLLSFALDGVLSFSIMPLRVFTVLGFIIAVLALGNAAFSVAITLYRSAQGITDVPGFPTLATGVFFLGGVQLIGIGLLGEYLGRVYDESKSRPIFIVKEQSPEISSNESGNQ